MMDDSDSSGTTHSPGTLTVPRRKSSADELARVTLYDDCGVLTKLFGDGHNSPNFMGNVANGVRLSCQIQLQELHSIVNRSQTPKAVKADDHKAPEKEMYDPLIAIVDAAERVQRDLSGSRREYFRKVICTGEKPLKSGDPPSMGIHGIKPDFSIAEVAPPSNGVLTSSPDGKAVMWRQCPAFLEVKASSGEAPNAEDSKSMSIKPSLLQAADYASAIFRARPMHIYVFGLLLCGDQFCIIHYDRSGVVLSPQYSIFEDTGFRYFIGALLYLSWVRSPVELGHCPTWTLAEGHTYYQTDRYPEFQVHMGYQEQDAGHTMRIRTLGPPLWCSDSFLGRGTSVWQAVHPGPASIDIYGDTIPGRYFPVILKNYWHTAGRPGERDIHDRILASFKNPLTVPVVSQPVSANDMPDYPRGAVCLRSDELSSMGGDVYYPGKEGVLVSVNRQRGDVLPEPEGPDKINHRVIMPDFGKSLWKYTSIEQFVRALLTAVEAHRVLWDRGILHRDISAANVLIRLVPEYITDKNPHELRVHELALERTEGFLVDFEYAAFLKDLEKDRTVIDHQGRVQKDTETGSTVVKYHPVRIPVPPKEPGEGMTGTMIFMATNVLSAYIRGETVPRSAIHDVESFYWVFFYILYRGALEDMVLSKRDIGTTWKALQEEFKLGFSGPAVKTLIQRRETRFSLKTNSEWAHVIGGNLYGGIAHLILYLREKLDKKALFTVRTLWNNLRELQKERPQSDADDERELRLHALELKAAAENAGKRRDGQSEHRTEGIDLDVFIQGDSQQTSRIEEVHAHNILIGSLRVLVRSLETARYTKASPSKAMES